MSLFNEDEADAITKAVGLIHNKRIVILGKDGIVNLIKSSSGKIYQVAEDQEVTRGELEERKHQAALAYSAAKTELEIFDRLNGAINEQQDNQAPEQEPNQVSQETPAPEPQSGQGVGGKIQLQ